jgi:hypothetical protein
MARIDELVFRRAGKKAQGGWALKFLPLLLLLAAKEQRPHVNHVPARCLWPVGEPPSHVRAKAGLGYSIRPIVLSRAPAVGLHQARPGGYGLASSFPGSAFRPSTAFPFQSLALDFSWRQTDFRGHLPSLGADTLDMPDMPNVREPSVHDWPICGICGQPVKVETGKTDEFGRAVHEDCYVLKVRLHRATS